MIRLRVHMAHGAVLPSQSHSLQHGVGVAHRQAGRGAGLTCTAEMPPTAEPCADDSLLLGMLSSRLLLQRRSTPTLVFKKSPALPTHDLSVCPAAVNFTFLAWERAVLPVPVDCTGGEGAMSFLGKLSKEISNMESWHPRREAAL